MRTLRVLLLKSVQEKSAVTTKRVTAVFKVCINLNLLKIARSRVWISTSTRFTTTSGKTNTLDFLVVASLMTTLRSLSSFSMGAQEGQQHLHGRKYRVVLLKMNALKDVKRTVHAMPWKPTVA
jgi:hypothetical protein